MLTITPSRKPERVRLERDLAGRTEIVTDEGCTEKTPSGQYVFLLLPVRQVNEFSEKSKDPLKSGHAREMKLRQDDGGDEHFPGL